MKYIYFILLTAFTLFISSCSHYKNVIVRGAPGTEIYRYDKKWRYGTIGPDGTVKLKLTSENSYYLSKAPGSDLYVPFAVDVRDGGLDEPGVFPLFVIPPVNYFCFLWAIPSQADKPIKEQMTNNDLFAQYEEFYRQQRATQLPDVATSRSSNAPFHQVKSGDTLGAIAKLYGVSVEEICQLNGISATTQLLVGQMLRVR